MEILSLVPNAENLDFDSLSLRVEKMPTSPTINETSVNDDLDLYQLKKLRFYRCDEEFLPVVNRIPVGVLTELELSDVNLNAYALLFQRQTNIKKLCCAHSLGDLYCTTIADDILDGLKLESLNWWYSIRDNINNAIVLSKQMQLKSLTLLNTEFDEEFMNFVVTHFTELETFVMDVSEQPSAACIAMIGTFKKLKDLSLTFNMGSMDQLKTLAKMRDTGITDLTLKHGPYGVNHIHGLVKSVPNLKVLRMECRIDALVFNAIVKDFNFVQVLKIDYYRNDNQSTDDNDDDGDSFNPKLMEFVITNSKLSSETALLMKPIADYPNLKKLKITFASITTSQFRQILNGFTKLESLKLLKGVRELMIDDLNYLKDQRNNLKFISLGHLNVIVTDEMKRQLSATFGVIIYDSGTLQMAVDRNTMNSEKW